ncbi:hypothetical protein SAMD00019534_105360 [Acytostelium subglobosum LB1]|uniref:hypothetical protein n=1 Tax=Acytostelium subglobosum LB1 TaxID=1410327 RepID=UPI000644EDCF|nr:hypothetical protein SAMD00019534_105360 [Acytostelium subglobosum LB1]GAM27361.1 hypothetical protein SAMD00019534_105360 [Acytostelium subglobosum LB1]|eukprot:XP_012749828.1 hypothetical protein SAMD00019534_105360 [Acytostelium subglobosum LB1]
MLRCIFINKTSIGRLLLHTQPSQQFARRTLISLSSTCNNKSLSTIHQHNIYSSNSTRRSYTSTKQLDKNNLFDGSDDAITVDGYSQQGFSVNGVLLPGPIVVMPKALLLWDVHACSDITVDSLAVLSVIDPAIGENRIPLDEELVFEIKRRYNTAVEIMSTVNALGTYNILSEEGRKVAVFLLPMVPCREAKDTYYVSKKDYEDLQVDNSLSSSKQTSTSISDGPDYEPQSFKSEYKPTKNIEEAAKHQPTLLGRTLIWIAERLAPKDKNKNKKQ